VSVVLILRPSEGQEPLNWMVLGSPKFDTGHGRECLLGFPAFLS
jgi:hypothetical protein